MGMNGSASASVTFTGVSLDKTYTVYETDSSGSIISDPTSQNVDGWAKITYSGNVIKLTSDSASASAEINNYFESTRQAHGSVKVTKIVKVAGKEKATNNTYYTALFSDSACSDKTCSGHRR